MHEKAMNIPAAVFKAECLRLVDEVARTRKPIIITKDGKPIAQLIPISSQPKSFFGYMKHTLVISGDIVSPTEGAWNAVGDEEDHLIEITSKRASTKQRRLRK